MSEKCIKCDKVANIIVIIDKEEKVLKFCFDCAKEEGFFDSKLIPVDALRKIEKIRVGKCPNCGYSYKEFKEYSFLGCPECYRYFSPLIEKYLSKIHGSLIHKGKFPSSFKKKRKNRNLVKLESELKSAIRKKDYRRIKEIKSKIRRLNGIS